MFEQLVVQTVWAVVAVGLGILAIRRTARRVEEAEARRDAEYEVQHQRRLAELRQQIAALEAESAARRAAWEAEQAALDAEAATPAR